MPAPSTRARAAPDRYPGRRRLPATIGRRLPGLLLLLRVSVTPDQVRDLTDLRRVVHKLGGGGAATPEVLARLRNHGDVLTLTARLRRSGMTDAAVAAALFDGRAADV